MGTSEIDIIGTEQIEDHPHAYGDKKTKILLRSYHQGSSPRVWGQGERTAATTEGSGIIPTRMGTSLQVLKYALLTGDHPHAYGDKTQIDYISMTELGSSPRVWGQEVNAFITEYNQRIIPTRMGTSWFRYMVSV